MSEVVSEKSIDQPKKKNKKTWSKSTRDENGFSVSVNVEELDNGGFLINTSSYGDKNGKYIDENKKYFADKNPLEDQETNEDRDEKINSLFEPKYTQLLKD